MEALMGLGESVALCQRTACWHTNTACGYRSSLVKCSHSCRATISDRRAAMPISMPSLQDCSYSGTDLRSRRLENVEGAFYVDKSCIDCDACRWIAPDNFSRIGKMSAVAKQPTVEEEETAMLQALLSCPTKSIHTSQPPPDFGNVGSLFPLAIHGLPGVYHCGYHSQKSDGATPFLITSPEGNILVDSPRYTDTLAHEIAKLGGVKYMFLTHLHDVADHAKWQRRFQCDRVMHLGDIKPDTFNVEMKLEGSGPWDIGHHFELIYTPGHTVGSVCLLHKPLKALFSGDHIGLASSGDLTIWPEYCQHSVKRQLDSLSALLPIDFEWILPGHARRIKFDSLERKNAAILQLVEQQTCVPSFFKP